MTRREGSLYSNICSIGEKKNKKPEAFGCSDGRADGRTSRMLSAICHP